MGAIEIQSVYTIAEDTELRHIVTLDYPFDDNEPSDKEVVTALQDRVCVNCPARALCSIHPEEPLPSKWPYSVLPGDTDRDARRGFVRAVYVVTNQIESNALDTPVSCKASTESQVAYNIFFKPPGPPPNIRSN